MTIPSEPAQRDDDRRRAGLVHQPRRLADRRGGGDDGRLRADQRADRLVCRIAAVGGAGAGPASPSASPRVVSSERATKPTLSGRASTRSAASCADPVAERVLVRAGGETGGQAGQHRAVAEQLADAEQVEHDLVVDDLDGAAAHDAHVLRRLRALREDRRPGEVELDLRRGGDVLDVADRQRVEGRVDAEELDDVGERPGRRGGQPPGGLAAAGL